MKPIKISADANGIFRYPLKNGSVLLVKEDRSTPVVSLNLWVEAGSIDERPDERGMAHLIEHMIFKGTPKRGVGEISRQVEAAGGYLNAFTSYEHTCFYVVLPSSQIRKALEIEFDAYLHSTFDAGELAKEKEVVFEEMRMRRDDPWSWSWELLFHLLYQKNPYHWPVIGDMQILKGVPRERLLRYYKTHYVPSNTVISVVGDVSASAVASWVKDHFEKISMPAAPPRKFNFDGEPKKLQLHLEEGEVQQVYLSLAFPAVNLEDPDSPALEILEAVLSEGASGRLNLAIREKSQSADEIGGEYFSGKYGGAFVFQCLTDSKRLEECVKEIMVEVGKIIQKGVRESELQKVKNKIKASKIFEKQNMDGQAKSLGFWELQGGYHLEEKFLKALDLVTVDDLKRVAERYLAPPRASLVLYHPKGQKPVSDPSYWQSLLQKGLDSVIPSFRGPQKREAKIRQVKLQNGSTLWVKERKNLPLVSLGAFLQGGFRQESAKNYGITTLMTKCLLKGTQRKSHEAFSHEIEGYAAHLDPSMEKDYWGLTLDVSRPNFEKAFDLMLEVLREPQFSETEVAKEKKLQIAAIQRLKDDPAELALVQSDVLTFDQTPYGHFPMGTQETISHLTPQDLKAWHRHHLSAKTMTWVAVGDVDLEELKKFLDARLPLFTEKAKPSPRLGKAPVLRPKVLQLNNDGQQANMVLGFRAPAFHSKDYFTFRVLNTILNGMGGKLFGELREKRSLAYSVYASHDAGALAGIYQIYIGCAPSKMAEAKGALQTVLRQFAEKRVSADELERAKTYMVGLYQVGLQTNRAQVHSYARYELVGEGAHGVEHFPERVRKVTATDIQLAARKYLETDQRTWVVLSPKKK